MPAITTGNALAVRSGWSQDFDPTTGWQTTETWNGNKAQIGAIAPLFRSAGAKVSVSNSGALWTLVATWSVEYSSNLDAGIPAGSPPATVETANETWNLNVEQVQVDLRSAPSLLVLFGGATEAAQETLSGAIQLADDAIKARLNPDDYLVSIGLPAIPPSSQLNYFKIYRLRARGVQAVEEKRPILTRNRSFSPTFPTPVQVTGVDVVYSSQTLISTFAVPALVQSRMPVTPPVTITEAAWGWKQRRQDSQFNVARNRIDEGSDWIFAQWSNVLYTIL